MKRSLLAGLALALVSSTAHADDKHVVTADMGSGITMIGPNTRHMTGGFTLRGAVDYAIPLGGSAQVGLGVNGSVFGMGGQPGSVGFFVGPMVRLVAQPIEGHRSWNAALSIGLDFGRFAQCTRWEHPLCPHMIGFDPSIRPGIFYRADSGVIFGAYGAVRFMPTWIAFTVAGEAGLSIGATFTRL